MSTSVTALTLDGLDKLPPHARRCLFWEVDPSVGNGSNDFADPVFEKEAWLSTIMLEWGSCGQVALVDGRPAGSAIYSPPGSVPRADLFPTSPVSADAVLLTTLRVESADQVDGGIGEELIQAVVRDLVRRGVRAIEAFGIRLDVSATVVQTQPHASAALVCSAESCMIDAEFLTGAGFSVVAPHHRFPRLRLELDTDHGWKEDVEYALDQLLAAAAAERTLVTA